MVTWEPYFFFTGGGAAFGLGLLGSSFLQHPLAWHTQLQFSNTNVCTYVHPDTQIAGSWARVWQPSLGITAESSRVVQWKWAARIHRTQSVGRRLVWPTPPCPLRSPWKRCIRQQFSIICVALLGGCPDGFVFCIFVVAAAVYAN